MVKEQLNEETGRRLLGDLYKNVVYYNHDTGKWNRQTYIGNYRIYKQDLDTIYSKRLKWQLDNTPDFFKAYELVANVTVIVKDTYFPNIAKWTKVKDIKFSPSGTSVLGNLIVRRNDSGKLEMWSPFWIGVMDYSFTVDAVEDGAFKFAYFCCDLPVFRRTMITGRSR